MHPAELEILYQDLPKPYLMSGDFNAHSYLWGNYRDDTRDNTIESFMHKNNLCLWNNYSPTYLHPATGSLTAIDLTMCSPHLSLDSSWSVEDDQWGNDH